MRSTGFAVGFLALTVVTAVNGEYREITIENGATITGQVRATGEVPALPPQTVFKQTEHCGTTVPDERLVVGKGGALANVVVYVTNVKAGKAAPLGQPVKLENEKCRFVPHVVSATLGQTLAIHNGDPFLHDTHATLGSRTLFNVGILSGHTVKQPLLEAGMIDLNCNVRHTWMHGYAFVAEHTYHAVTDAEGRFRIDNLPGGQWTLRAWHEMLGSTDREVRVMPGEARDVEINLQGGE